MRSILKNLLYLLIKTVFRLRYRPHFTGLDRLQKEKLNRGGGILFLPNHPAQIDSVFTLWAITNFNPRPAAIEYLYQMPLVSFLLNLVNAIPVPNIDFCGNNLKKQRVDKALDIIIAGLKRKENFVFYPSGRLKLTGIEVLGGASGVQKILQHAPDTNIVVVRVNGLWGSSFSRALTGSTPDLIKNLFEGFKTILKNAIFFAPKRDVYIEYMPNPEGFPFDGSRLAINHFLEDLYNKDKNGNCWQETRGEPLVSVSRKFWTEDFPPILEAPEQDRKVDLQSISPKIKSEIRSEIANLANKDPNDLNLDTHLAKDLGLDSLDATELLIFLEDNYNITGLYPSDLTTLQTVMGIAAGQIVIQHEEDDEAGLDTKSWINETGRKPVEIPEGETVGEVFIRSCQSAKKTWAITDNVGGPMRYKDLLLRSTLLADKIRQLPGERVGIMLPATSAAYIVINACILSGKVPVMINWTVGSKHLKHVLEISKVEKVLTSWKFLDNLENADLGDIGDYLVHLEDVRKEISWRDKAKAFFRSRKSPLDLLKTLQGKHPKSDDSCVILFTSGTETLPKGVPLSHNNLLSNLRAGLRAIQLESDSVILATLPPFHSFGFCVTGLLPLLCSVRAAYSPDPTNSVALARTIAKWNATLFASAPSFLRSMLKVAQEGQLTSLRMVVTGAERLSPEMASAIHKQLPDAVLLEGYGITECSPILTLTRPERARIGVGFPIDNVEIRILNADTLQALDNDEKQGLIVANGPNVFSGYLDYDGASPFIEMDQKTWYNTGDLGFIDEQGNLHISGRLKRFVKIGGEMISLGAIEDALEKAAMEKNWPMPEEGPCFAVSAIEEGDRPQLVLLTRSFLTLRDANDALKEQGLSNLSRLSVVKHVEEIPMTGTGKVNHRALKEQIKEVIQNV